MMIKINWKIFYGSSHCSEGLAFFSVGKIKTLKEFETWFSPYMPEQAREVRKMVKSKRSISDLRRQAGRAFHRFEGGTVRELYGLTSKNISVF